MTRAFEVAGDRRGELVEAMAMPVETDLQKAEKIAAVKAIYDSLGVGEEAKNEIIRLNSQALAHAETLNIQPEAYALLEDYAKKLIGRTK